MGAMGLCESGLQKWERGCAGVGMQLSSLLLAVVSFECVCVCACAPGNPCPYEPHSQEESVARLWK